MDGEKWMKRFRWREVDEERSMERVNMDVEKYIERVWWRESGWREIDGESLMERDGWR
jgi:hypothetical protein